MEQYMMEIMQAVRLIVSCICGLAIGFERQRHILERNRTSAGMRTHMIVCVASAAMMLISKYGFLDMMVYGDNVRVDVSRVAAAVISGVGFLGAGIIYVRRESIKGLTTSAGIWATCAVGMAIGCGMYFAGIILTVFVVIIQEMSHIRLYNEKAKTKTVHLRLDGGVHNTKKILDWMRDRNIEIRDVVRERGADGSVRMTLHLRAEEFSQEIFLDLQEEFDCVKRVEF